MGNVGYQSRERILPSNKHTFLPTFLDMDRELADKIIKEQSAKSGICINPEVMSCIVDAMIEYAKKVAYDMFQKALDEEGQINKEAAQQRYMKAVKKLQIMFDGTGEVFYKYIFDALRVAAGLDEYEPC